MSNLPSWNGASGAYSRAYRILANMARNGHVQSRMKPCSVSQEMRDYIHALNRGDEEQIKYYNLLYLKFDVAAR